MTRPAENSTGDGASVYCYVQYPDFEIERRGRVSLDEALELIEEYPDDEARTEFVMAQQEGEQACPPLVGFEDSRGGFVELATLTRGEHLLRVRARRERRLLLLRWRRWDERCVAMSHIDPARDVLRLFFQGRHDRIWPLLRNFPTPE